jgi:hypothetical protein
MVKPQVMQWLSGSVSRETHAFKYFAGYPSKFISQGKIAAVKVCNIFNIR